MIIENIRYTTYKNYPALKLTIDGKEALILDDLKRTLLEEGYLFLGIEFREDYRVTIPARPSLGRPETEMWGGTDNPEVIAIVRAWLESLGEL